MEIKQACIVESAKKHAVKEAFEKLKEIIHKVDYIGGYAEIGFIEEIDELFTVLYGVDK